MSGPCEPPPLSMARRDPDEPKGASALPPLTGDFVRVVLVGFMGAGKSIVGRRLARRLKWRFIDVDQRVEQAAGMSIPQIFATQGETAFRELEDKVAQRVLKGTHAVISTGGGWPVRDDRMAKLPAGTLSVWLVVDAATAVSRASRRFGQRPLLATDDPMATARELLAEREPEYARADLHLVTHGSSPEGLVEAIAKHLEASTEQGRGSDAADSTPSS